MTVNLPNELLLADNVLVASGQSWYSEQLYLNKNSAGVAFEVTLTGSGDGDFVPRAGVASRYKGASFVATTDTTTTGGDHLPAITGITSTDLPDPTEAPKEWLINLGNLNANYAELEFKCTSGFFRITVRVCQKAG